MSNSQFVHICCTDRSLTHGLMDAKEAAKQAKSLGMNSLIVMDDMNMFSTLAVFNKLPKEGVKPIMGVSILVNEEGVSPYRLGLIAKNEIGYKNLIKMVSKAYEEGFIEETAYVNREWIEPLSEGLIAISGGVHGDIGKCILNDKMNHAARRANEWKRIFGEDFYIELQRIGRKEDDKYVESAVAVAEHCGIPVMASNDVQFKKSSDYIAHCIRVCNAENITLQKYMENDQLSSRYTPQQYMKSPEEMTEIWSDVPSAIENTKIIAQKCTFEIEQGKNYLPEFKADMPESDYLIKVSKEGLEERLDKILDKNDPEYAAKRKVFDDRLDFELNVINGMGFPGYFLIVADFIQWSKDNDIPVGPGRGSGAGSLVAYALKITDLDPIEFDLLFERFLNPDRVSMPDFDIDFCQARRDDVIKYVSDKYGHKAVSQIVTFGTMTTRSAFLDVSRVLGKSVRFGLDLSKKVPDVLGVSIADCLEDGTFRLAYDTSPDIQEVVEYAKLLENKTRGTGKHAGGVIIAPGQLTDFCATYNEPDGSGFVTQYDKKDVESVGLVKFDFLGLKTLDIIHEAVSQVNAKKVDNNEEKISISDIDLNDQKVYDDILMQAKTSAVFQLESAGMKELILRLKPNSFNDIIALVALFRPGPMQAGMVDTYVQCKNGLQAVELLHPKLDKVLGDTYGVLVYQEQVMQTAQVLAGYTLGGADMLRRAMGKKDEAEMQLMREFFVHGSEEHNIPGCVKMGIPETEAKRIFNLIEKFAGYGFNKSHSAAYALVSYQTAWLKTYYPEEFMSAVMTLDQNVLEKVVFYMNEAQDMGIVVEPPNINDSVDKFHSNSKGTISFSMKAVKGLGDAAVRKIISERNENGKYKDLYDFIIRTGSNKKTIEACIKSGMMDVFGVSRAQLMATFPEIQAKVKKMKDKFNRDKKKGVNLDGDLFDYDDGDRINYVDAEPLSLQEVLKGERETLGMYISGHPINPYAEEAKSFISGKLRDLKEMAVDTSEIKPQEDDDIEDEVELDENVNHAALKAKDIKVPKPKVKKEKKDKNVSVLGVIVSHEVKKTWQGDPMAVLVLDDGTSQIDVTVIGEDFNRLRPMMQADNLIYIEGRLMWKEKMEKWSLSARKARTIDEIRTEKLSHISLNIKDLGDEKEIMDRIVTTASSSQRGPCKIEVVKADNTGVLPHGFSLTIKEKTISDFENIVGKENIKVVYKNSPEAINANATLDKTLDDPELKMRRQNERRKRFFECLEEAKLTF